MRKLKVTTVYVSSVDDDNIWHRISGQLSSSSDIDYYRIILGHGTLTVDIDHENDTDANNDELTA